MTPREMTDLTTIPGVGRSIAQDLRNLGFEYVEDLKGEDAEELYDRLCLQRGQHIDRCVLYVFRCAVYYATEKEHDPDLLKWWNWKDRALAN